MSLFWLNDDEKEEEIVWEGKKLSAWIADLKSKDDNAKMMALATMAEMGSLAQEALGRIIRLLRHPDFKVREQAAKALGRTRSQTRREIKPLIRALRDKESLVREAAAQALGRLGPLARRAVKPLERAANDKEKRVAIMAHFAMAAITGELFDNVPILIEAMEDPDKGARCSACVSLGDLGPAVFMGPYGHEALSRLVRALEDEDRWARYYATTALGQMNFYAKTAIPALNKVVAGQDTWLSSAAARSISRIEGKAPPAGADYPAAAAARAVRRRRRLLKKVARAGVVVLVVGAIMLLTIRRHYRPKASTTPEERADLAAEYSQDSETFVARYFDKDVGYTPEDIINRAKEDGISRDVAFNLLFDAIAKGLIKGEQPDRSKPCIYKLK